MCSTAELKQITQLIASVYKNQFKDRLDKVYLYGSYARGDNDADSDIDIVAIVREDRKTVEEQLKKVWNEAFEIAYNFDVVISPTAISYDEFEKMKIDLPYYRNIWNEGVEIIA